MKLLVCFTILCAVASSSCDKQATKGDDELLLMEVDVAKPKRQAEQARAIGVTHQHLYGSAPGHYVLRTSPKDASEPEPDYLSILRQLESANLQPAAAQDRPAVQQYLLPRQSAYSIGQSAEPKVVQIQPKRPYAQNVQYQNVQNVQNIQNARPLVLRPAQAVRPTVQGIYTNQGFLSSPTHALHEARVQAALSVADDKQYVQQTVRQPTFQYVKPQPVSSSVESSFEKELAQLVAANQAQELKTKPEQLQYAQPQKQYALVPARPKQYTLTRPESEKYVAPVVRAKPQQLPQQYLIETTKPQPVAPVRQVVSQPRPQIHYYQVTTEEPRYYESEDYSVKVGAMRVVPAPQLQAAPQHQQIQYRPVAQKQPAEPKAPAYVQYYQAIRQQQDDTTSANDVKLETHVPRFATKQRPTTQTPVQIPSYTTKYEPQTKAEDQYVRYKAAKPQLTSQYAEDDGALQALFAQAVKNSQQQEAQQGLAAYSTTKTASTETKPQVAPSHSAIFVSKALTPKKKVTRPVEPTEESESDEIQTVRLPPPKNNKVYTQEEFQALVAAGYAVTPVPVTDDDDTAPAFSPAPENYPGHSKYQPSPAPETQSYAAATEAPRTRKAPRRRPASRLSYRLQPENNESESQSQPSYAYPLETQETVRYGMKKQTKSRVHHQEDEEEA